MSSGAEISTEKAAGAPHVLRLRRIGIDTYQEAVIYMRADCAVCRSEGFGSRSRVRVATARAAVVATLNIVQGDLLRDGEAGLSEVAWRRLDARDGELAMVSHPEPVESFGAVRAKLYGRQLSSEQYQAVVQDIASNRYTDVQLSAFVSACTLERLDLNEVVSLTQAMVGAGRRLTWRFPRVVDKHCIGGLPGNRTTPIVVAIVAACGVPMPKTSSRAITSPAGTADTMETLAPVDLDLAAMRRVVDAEGGCVVWGGGVNLSPADDVLIRVERALDIDSEAQLVASVLSKKIAAGATHVVIDVPVGATAKVRSTAAAERLIALLQTVGARLGLEVTVEITDGREPVGRGIGPALEARDVLAVLQGQPEAPADLRARALRLAGRSLEIAGVTVPGAGRAKATEVLEQGMAWRKFLAICEAQGGLREPPRASHAREIASGRAGVVREIDNRRLARIAKLAGAPAARAAGVELAVRIGDTVAQGQRLYTLHAETPGELAYALHYLSAQAEVVRIKEP